MTATVHSLSGVQQGSTINMVEVSSGQYSGDFSVIALPDGQYSVNFLASGVSVGFGELYARNGSEVTQDQFEIKSEADTRQAALIVEHDQTQADVAALNDFDPTTTEVNANIVKVNNLSVDGTGTEDDPWGPS